MVANTLGIGLPLSKSFGGRGAVPAVIFNDSLGNAAGLVDPRGRRLVDANQQNVIRPTWTYWSPAVQDVVPTITNLSSVTRVDITFEDIKGERWIVFTAATTGVGASFHIAWNTPLAFASGVNVDSCLIEFLCEDPFRNALSVFVAQDAGYAANANTGNFNLFGANNSDPISLGAHTVLSFTEERFNASKTGYTYPTIQAPTVVAKIAVTFANVASGPQVFKLRSFQLGVAARKSRLAIIMDDGARSFLVRGVPILQSFGIRSTAALIQDGIVNATKTGFNATLDDWKAYVDDGNSCISHGTNNGAANLYAGVFAGGATAALNARRMADVNLTRDYLVANNLCTDAGAKCYAWPQGIWNVGTGETSLLDAARAEGYRLCRAATARPGSIVIAPGSNPMNFQTLRAMSANNYMNMVLPVNGHSWAGTAEAERLNITQLCNTVLPALAASGGDGILMFHSCVPAGTEASTTDIGADNLTEIASTIQALSASLSTVAFEDFLNKD